MEPRYRILVEGDELSDLRVNGGGLPPKALEMIFSALLAGLQREILAARLGLPAFGAKIVTPPVDGRY